MRPKASWFECTTISAAEIATIAHPPDSTTVTPYLARSWLTRIVERPASGRRSSPPSDANGLAELLARLHNGRISFYIVCVLVTLGMTISAWHHIWRSFAATIAAPGYLSVTVADTSF